MGRSCSDHHGALHAQGWGRASAGKRQRLLQDEVAILMRNGLFGLKAISLWGCWGQSLSESQRRLICLGRSMQISMMQLL